MPAPDRRGQQLGADLVAQDEHPEAGPLEPQSVGHGHDRIDVDLRPDQDRVLVGTAGQPAIQLSSVDTTWLPCPTDEASELARAESASTMTGMVPSLWCVGDGRAGGGLLVEVARRCAAIFAIWELSVSRANDTT
jgi:hypothetical protein